MKDWEGRRNRFIGPVKLYLIFFAVMLLLYSIHQETAVFDVRATSSSAAANAQLNGDRRADCRMRVVADEREIFEPEIADLLHGWIELHARERAKAARELLARLLEVVLIQV